LPREGRGSLRIEWRVNGALFRNDLALARVGIASGRAHDRFD